MWLVTNALVFAMLALAPQQPRVVEMEACRVGLTPAGQSARFQATVIYDVAIDGDGSVAELKPLQTYELKSLQTYDFLKVVVEVDKFESCVRRWKFSGGGKTVVTFFAGTSGGAWRISVSSGGKILTLVLG